MGVACELDYSHDWKSHKPQPVCGWSIKSCFPLLVLDARQGYDGGVKVDAYFLVSGLKADMLHCSLTFTVSQILVLPTY